MTIKGSPEWSEHALHPEKSDMGESPELAQPAARPTDPNERVEAAEMPGTAGGAFVEGTVEDRPLGHNDPQPDLDGDRQPDTPPGPRP